MATCPHVTLASSARNNSHRSISRTSDRCSPHVHPLFWCCQWSPCCSCLPHLVPELYPVIGKATVVVCIQNISIYSKINQVNTRRICEERLTLSDHPLLLFSSHPHFP